MVDSEIIKMLKNVFKIDCNLKISIVTICSQIFTNESNFNIK